MRLLTKTPNLAQHFDEVFDIDAAARTLLRAIMRLVEGFTSVFIDPFEAQLLIDFSQSLLDSLDN